MCRAHQPGIPEHAVDARGADSHHVGVEHHERQPPITLEGMGEVEGDDRLLLPVLQPPVPGDVSVVFIDKAVAAPPVVELAQRDAQPGDELPSRDLGAFNPVPDVIHDGIADVMGNPSLAQSSPSSFFSWTCSSISSATTSFLRWSFCRMRGDGPLVLGVGVVVLAL